MSEDNASTVVVNGEIYEIELKEGAEEGVVVTNTASSNTTSSSLEIKAGLPGSIFKVLVNVGDSVEKGQAVIVIEAMKMEIPVVAPEDGTVASIDAAVGDAIEAGAVLATLN